MSRKSRGKARDPHRERERAHGQQAAKAPARLAPDRVVLALSIVGMLLTAYLSVVAWPLSPVVSTIRSFRAEYEAHIREKRCPAGSCQKLKRITDRKSVV